MPLVIADISVSLDGFVTGPRPDLRHGLGVGGEPLHTWAMDSDDPVDVDVLEATRTRTGAVVLGRKLFDIVDGPAGWDDEVGYGGRTSQHRGPQCFVVTHRHPRTVRLKDRFSIVTDGLDQALNDATDAAIARGGDVVVMGGATLVRQCLDRGLIEELHLHLAPVVLGSGTHLFGAVRPRQLEQVDVRVSPNATHLTYRVPRWS